MLDWFLCRRQKNQRWVFLIQTPACCQSKHWLLASNPAWKTLLVLNDSLLPLALGLSWYPKHHRDQSSPWTRKRSQAAGQQMAAPPSPGQLSPPVFPVTLRQGGPSTSLPPLLPLLHSLELPKSIQEPGLNSFLTLTT